MNTPSHAELHAAVAAARAVIKADSSLYNSMITDELLIPVINAALTAAMNIAAAAAPTVKATP